DADADLAFVEALCLRLAVPLHVHRVSVPDRLAQSRASGDAETTEEAARNLRYQVFARLIAEGHADSILTAHTLDDQAETVMMKLLRGAWTEGLSGIHPIVRVADLNLAPRSSDLPHKGTGTREQEARGKILRPLLVTRRTELEDYLRSHNQPWRTDSSNADEAFTRNRVRHHLLPILREYNPAIDTALANLATLARDDEARWQAELARILPQLLLPGKPVRGGGRAVSTTASQSISLELDRLRTLDPALRRRVVRAAARSLGVRLSFDSTDRLLTLAGLAPEADLTFESLTSAAKPRPSASLHLPTGLRAQRTARELQLSRE
ncbi:MAG TPA: tRNA lysidine(34) synthetase TilS, partial [Acidobacteriaceae bacterium]